MKLPRENTHSLKVLQFIGRGPGGKRYIDIAKYIVTQLQNREWDPPRHSCTWAASLYDYGSRKGLFSKYCVSFEKRWYLSAETMRALVKREEGVALYFGRAASSSITTLDTGQIRDLSVENVEFIPTLKPLLSDMLHPNGHYNFSSPRMVKPTAAVLEIEPPLPMQPLLAIQAMQFARAEVDGLEIEFDRISQKLAVARAEQATHEDNVRKVLDL